MFWISTSAWFFPEAQIFSAKRFFFGKNNTWLFGEQVTGGPVRCFESKLLIFGVFQLDELHETTSQQKIHMLWFRWFFLTQGGVRCILRLTSMFIFPGVPILHAGLSSEPRLRWVKVEVRQVTRAPSLPRSPNLVTLESPWSFEPASLWPYFFIVRSVSIYMMMKHLQLFHTFGRVLGPDRRSSKTQLAG